MLGGPPKNNLVISSTIKLYRRSDKLKQFACIEEFQTWYI